MLYMVDHVFGDPALEPAWHGWYAGYLKKLVAVPGIRSAQRFKAPGSSPSRYLAIYSVDSADVFASEAYRRMGGGGSQSARFHPAYRLWTRNLFAAAPAESADPDADIRSPEVAPDERLIVFDRTERAPSGAIESRATWLVAVGLHRTTPYRGYVVLDAESAAAASVPGSFLYEPFTPVIV